MAEQHISAYSGAQLDAAIGKALTLPEIVAGTAGKVPVVGSGETAMEYQYMLPSGVSMLFNQASAPVGWTKKSNWADNATLIVGNTFGSGGSASALSFTTGITVGAHATHSHSGPDHFHTYSGVIAHEHLLAGPSGGTAGITSANYITSSIDSGQAYRDYAFRGTSGVASVGRSSSVGSASQNTSSAGTGNTGSGGPTTHSVGQSTYSPKYQIVIAATKD